MPSARDRFVLSEAGSCTFCGKDRAEVVALVAIDGRPMRICNECIGLCWDLLAEEIELVVPDHPQTPLTIRVGDERFEAHTADVMRRLAETREARQAVMSDQRRFDYRPDLGERFRCSFCDAPRMDVLKLISGPRVFICDRCVVDVTAVVVPLLRAT